MSKTPKAPRALALFYVLVAYVLIQFSWWTYLLVKLNNEIIEQQIAFVSPPADEIVDDLQKADIAEQIQFLESKLHKQWMMIAGEGTVFLVLLLVGILQTRKSFHKEKALADRQKNFLLSVTHELKSPLASVALQVETVMKRDLLKEKRDEILSHALEDAGRLNALVENILTAARIENHTFSLNKQKCDLFEFLNELVKKAEVSYARNHAVVFTGQQRSMVTMDKVAAHSIFTNLIENAAKYSSAGSKIDIALTERGEAQVVRISDNGAGITDDQKKKIFDLFYRSGDEETRKTKGTGLGLYITKYLSDMHGWSISVKDNPAGGSIFEVTIPKTHE